MDKNPHKNLFSKTQKQKHYSLGEIKIIVKIINSIRKRKLSINVIIAFTENIIILPK